MRTHQDAAGPDPFANDYMALIHAHESPAYTLEGCSVSDGGSNDLTVDIASGTVVSQGSKHSINSTTVTLASANSFKRYDLIVVDNTGTVTDRTGSTEKKAPDMQQGDVLLAIVEVPANASGVTNTNIFDARILTEGDARATGTTVIEGDADDTGSGTVDIAIAGTTVARAMNNKAFCGNPNQLADASDARGDFQWNSESKAPLFWVDSDADQVPIGGASDPDYGELFVHGRDTGTGAANDIVATLGEDDDTVQVNDNNTTSLDLVRIQSPSLTSNSGFTVADLSSLRIAGAPDDSDANVTATNKWALKIDSGASTFGGNVTHGSPGQDYEYGGRSNALTRQAQSGGSPSLHEYYTADGDGTDDLRLRLFAVGTPSAITDRESLSVMYDSVNTRFQLLSNANGTGTVRPVHVITSGNPDQFVARTDGNNSMSGGLLVGGTGSPAGDIGAKATGISVMSLDGDTDTNASAGDTLANYQARWNGTRVGQIRFVAGDDDTNRDEGDWVFDTANAGTLSEVARFHQEGVVELGQSGDVGIGTGSPSDRVHVTGSSPHIRQENTDGGSDFLLRLTQSGGTAQWALRDVDNNRTLLQVFDDETSPRLPNVPSASQSSDLVLDSNNQMVTPSSSKRYKTDYQPVDGDTLLDLTPRTFVHHGEGREAGLIAEEVARVDPRLVRWEDPDDLQDQPSEAYLAEHARADGQVPDGVHYKQLHAHHIDKAQDHEERLEELEREVGIA